MSGMMRNKERLQEERANYESMSDADLAFEVASLAENIESLKIELRLFGERQVERPDGWQPRAEHALAMLKGRAALCGTEQKRRKQIGEDGRAEQWRIEQDKRRAERERRQAAHQELVQQAQERKKARIAAADQWNRGQQKSFVRHAYRMLPQELFDAIWAAVAADEQSGERRTESESSVEKVDASARGASQARLEAAQRPRVD